ncbi:MAG: penicillin-binding transpeptidase domain-containing protein [Patescibacteria group bacterium]
MIRKFFTKRKVKEANFFVEPDEIFLDSKNIGNFDRQQFEGRLEKSISKNTVLFLGLAFLLATFIFGTRLGYLQIVKGNAYLLRSEKNVLSQDIIFADRGIIYDRNRVELAWNKESTRAYFSPGFSHVLGYVSYPARDSSGVWWQTEFIGRDGLEKEYNDKLNGVNGSKIVEVDAAGEVHSENIVNAPVRGEDLVTTLDSRLSSELYRLIKGLAEGNAFTGGAGVILDARNGEVLAATSFPEYDSEVLSRGEDSNLIDGYISDKRKVFLDRTISGLYTPGSIVKPFLALGALAEKIIDPAKKILSTGSIAIPNPYDKTKETIFRDWKAHGWTDMRQALAVSSDVYFYTIGGGFKDQRGLGILNIKKYLELFGIGQKSGVDLPDEKGGTIPSPEWKIKNFPGDPWRVGDTYNTAIGQYGFQVTPMEMARASATIANYGKLVTPHFLAGDKAKEEVVVDLGLPQEYFKVVYEGMRGSATYGTASILNVPYVEVAAKTGTAELGAAKNRINSWIVGFFPYEDPKYAFTVLMESGPTGASGASGVMRGLLDWMSINTPEYFE